MHDLPRLLGTTSPHGEPVKVKPFSTWSEWQENPDRADGVGFPEWDRSRSRNHVGCRLSEARTET